MKLVTSASAERILIAYSTFLIAFAGVVFSPAVKAHHGELQALILLALAALLLAAGKHSGWTARMGDRGDYAAELPVGAAPSFRWQSATVFCVCFLLCAGYVGVTGGISSPYFFVFYFPIVMSGLRFGLPVSLVLSLLVSAAYTALARSVFSAPGLLTAITLSFPFVALLGGAADLTLNQNTRQLARRIRELDSLMDISRMLETSLDLATTLNLIMLNAPEALKFSRCAIYLASADDEGVLCLQNRYLNALLPPLMPRLVVAPDFRDRRRYFYDQALVFDAGQVKMPPSNVIGPDEAVIFDPAGSQAVYAPIRGAEGLIGMLCFSRKPGDESFSANDIAAAVRYASHVGLSLQQALYRDRLEQMAFNDTITGLANFRYIERRLGEEISRSNRNNYPLSVILIDIDHFKKFNDLYGHQAGDAVLSQVGAVLKSILREADTPARYGGEEFVIVCPETTVSQAATVMERVRDAIASTDMVLPSSGNEKRAHVRVTVSVGSATFPVDANSSFDLIRLADKALYAAKSAGRNRTANAADIRARAA